MMKNKVLPAVIFCSLFAFSCPNLVNAADLMPSAAGPALEDTMQDMLRAPVDSPKQNTTERRSLEPWVDAGDHFVRIGPFVFRW